MANLNTSSVLTMGGVCHARAFLPRGGEFGVWTKEGARAGWKLNGIM